MALFALPPSNSALWNPSKVSLAVYGGFHLNRGWVGSILIDNFMPNATIQLRTLVFKKYTELSKTFPLLKDTASYAATAYVCLVLFFRVRDISFSFNRLESVLTPARVTPFTKGWIPNPKGPCFLIATLLMVLNTTKFIKEMANMPAIEEMESDDTDEMESDDTDEMESDDTDEVEHDDTITFDLKNVEIDDPSYIEIESDGETELPVKNQTPSSFTDRFLVIVWKATPYLMIITNLAVTAMHIYKGRSDYWITLAVTGVTLLPMTSLVPQSFVNYLSNCSIPIDIAAFWFGDYYVRRSIIVAYVFQAIF